ncbi:MAG TPA: nucleotide exchange factor GrpE [Erysipelotrichaceae bacterium]|nr:nucleotide exchange factor GrpE [Erysipelotrichaceae bacterium]
MSKEKKIKKEKVEKKLKEQEIDVEEKQLNEETIQDTPIEEVEVVDELTQASARIAELEGEVVKLKNEYFKAYADAENMKKRLQNDFDSRMKYRIQSFALDILPVIDNLERALGNTQQQDSNDSVLKGIEMIYMQLIEALKKEGVEEINALNQPFDPNFHHALMMETIEGVDANLVVEVLQKGYKLKDRILRASLVKVSE